MAAIMNECNGERDLPLPPLPPPDGTMPGTRGIVGYWSRDKMLRYGRICAMAYAPAGQITEADIAWAHAIIAAQPCSPTSDNLTSAQDK